LKSCGKWHQLQRDERLSEAGNRVLRDLALMDRASRRVVAQVGLAGLSTLPSADLQVLSREISRTCSASRQAVLVLEEALSASNEERDGIG
jgi:hypothetical protein